MSNRLEDGVFHVPNILIDIIEFSLMWINFPCHAEIRKFGNERRKRTSPAHVLTNIDTEFSEHHSKDVYVNNNEWWVMSV